MGTPDFALPCLERIIADNHKVLAVFCQPDRPKGRGMKLLPPPVKEMALRCGIPVFQPTKLKDGEVSKLLSALAPDLMVVVAYGRLLPPEILGIPPLGCINVHASLLPRWRGAAPIQWSIIRGDTLTGVTTMYMDEGLDTGDIILKSETDIHPNETGGELFERLSVMGANLLGKTMELLADGTAPRMPQDECLSTLAPPIDKNLARLDFTKPPIDLCNLVRGLSPSPGAVTSFEGMLLKVHRVIVSDFTGCPGEILHPRRLIVGCGEGAVELLDIQPQGKKTMDGRAWLNGLRGQVEGRKLG